MHRRFRKKSTPPKPTWPTRTPDQLASLLIHTDSADQWLINRLRELGHQWPENDQSLIQRCAKTEARLDREVAEGWHPFDPGEY